MKRSFHLNILPLQYWYSETAKETIKELRETQIFCRREKKKKNKNKLYYDWLQIYVNISVLGLSLMWTGVRKKTVSVTAAGSTRHCDDNYHVQSWTLPLSSRIWFYITVHFLLSISGEVLLIQHNYCFYKICRFAFKCICSIYVKERLSQALNNKLTAFGTGEIALFLWNPFELQAESLGWRTCAVCNHRKCVWIISDQWLTLTMDTRSSGRMPQALLLAVLFCNVIIISEAALSSSSSSSNKEQFVFRDSRQGKNNTSFLYHCSLLVLGVHFSIPSCSTW